MTNTGTESNNKAPLLFLGGVGALNLILFKIESMYLSDWWLRTDACPEPNAVCGQPPVVLFLNVLITMLVIGVVMATVNTYRGLVHDSE